MKLSTIFLLLFSPILAIAQDSQTDTSRSAESIQQSSKSMLKRKSKFYGNYIVKGYFLEGQIQLIGVGLSLRIVNGYKINQYATVGAGLGVDGVILPVNNKPLNGDLIPYAGFYFPFYLYFSGDFLKNDVTPFYALEGGYGLAIDPGGRAPMAVLHGGSIVSGGLGVRIYGDGAAVFTLSLKFEAQYVTTEVTQQGQSRYIATTERVSKFIFLPGFHFGFGFIK